MVTQTLDPRLADINNDEAPETTSFMYNAKLVTEEWTFLSLEKRQRGDYIKADVPYIHLAWQPLSYKITDGGMEGDNLEHTYVAIKTAQGELTPKGSGRDEVIKAFEKLGFQRKTVHDLSNASAVGKVFKVKRYNRQYKRQGQEEPIRGELMNVPVDTLPDDWAPAPGVEIPTYSRKPRDRAGTAVTSGTVVRPIGVTFESVADALVGVAATESAVRAFVLDRNDLAQGEVLDAALGNALFAKLTEMGLITNNGGVIARA